MIHFIYNLTIFRTFFNNTYEISYNLWKKIDLLFVQTITSIVCDKRGVILLPTCINTLFVLFRSFVELNPSRLKPNTISTYMRMLRSIYNRGVDTHQAPYVHGLFRDVFTGVDTRQKKAIPIGELHILLNKDPQSEKLRRTQAIANLLFQFCGMPFSDLAHLEKSNLKQGLLKYNRLKTGTPMSIEVLESAHNAIGGLYNKTDARHSPVTSYTLRHSWATTAKYRGVPIEMISESLGHKSIKTTQIYLKGFELEERTKVNKLNYSYVCNFKML